MQQLTCVTCCAWAIACANVAGDRLPRAIVRTSSCFAFAAGGIVIGFCFCFCFCFPSGSAAAAAASLASFPALPAVFAFFV